MPTDWLDEIAVKAAVTLAVDPGNRLAQGIERLIERLRAAEAVAENLLAELELLSQGMSGEVSGVKILAWEHTGLQETRGGTYG